MFSLAHCVVFYKHFKYTRTHARVDDVFSYIYIYILLLLF